MFIRQRKMNGKERYYLEHSVRMLDGKIRKVSVYLKDPSKLKKYKEEINDKIEEKQIGYAVKFYRKDPIFTEKLIKQIEEAKIGYKKIINKLTENQLKDVIDRFAVNFTYESNSIEGNSLTLKDVTFILKEKKVLTGKDLREIYETINTREALELIFNNEFRITKDDIIKLHKVLVKNAGVEYGFKKIPNELLGRNIKTTPPEKVSEEIEKLIGLYSKDDNIHPLQKAVFFHGKFEKIHPFDDGNGRTGRLLANIMLLNKGYPPLIIRKTQRIAYFNALEAFDSGHDDKLKRFFIEKFRETYEKFFRIYIKYI